MNYLSVVEVAKKWKLSERTVRNYCAQGRIEDALLKGKTWMIPADAKRPERRNRSEKSLRTLLNVLRAEKEKGISGGIYHKVQVELTYNSNHIEGSKLTQEETRLIFDTHTIGATSTSYNVDDIVETANHFRCIDLVIDQSAYALSESFIKRLHLVLKNGTSDSRKEWFAVGD